MLTVRLFERRPDFKNCFLIGASGGSIQRPLHNPPFFGNPFFGGESMKKDKDMGCIRLDPEQRLCPAYDRRSIKLFFMPEALMGFPVVDNFAEEHIQ